MVKTLLLLLLLMDEIADLDAWIDIIDKVRLSELQGHGKGLLLGWFEAHRRA